MISGNRLLTGFLLPHLPDTPSQAHVPMWGLMCTCNALLGYTYKLLGEGLQSSLSSLFGVHDYEDVTVLCVLFQDPPFCMMLRTEPEDGFVSEGPAAILPVSLVATPPCQPNAIQGSVRAPALLQSPASASVY